MTGWIIALSLLGALLPSLGVGRVYLRARADEAERRRVVAERGSHERVVAGDITKMMHGLYAPNDRLRIAATDLVLVLVGFVCTALATCLTAFN
ncbi:hypothetical protein ACT17Q_12685 [Cellulomonas sp. CW35]|uniref:hypothetical protein n=1 Tax=Cellulomonas sp. CW35 TaxID=3458249 RepID=UPI0040335EA5